MTAGAPQRLSDLRAAVIGTGFIGRVHIEALRRLGVQVVGVLGSSAARAGRQAEELGVGTVYPDLDALCADDAVDVVHVASPNDAHVEQVSAVVAAGRHVVCEKPLALTADDTARLWREAEDAGVVHAVNYNIRHYPEVVEARTRAAGLGDLRLVTGSYRQDWLAKADDWNWRVDTERGGPLRAVADIGSHLIDLTMFVTGRRVTRVLAQLDTYVPVRRRPVGPVETFSASAGGSADGGGAAEDVEVSTDDGAVLVIELEGGGRGVLTVSQVSMGHRNDVELDVAGAQGSVAWRSVENERLWLGHRDSANQVLERDPALLGAAAARTSTLPAGHAEGFRDTFAALYRSVYSRVLDPAAEVPAPFATFADGHAEALVLEAVRASASTSAWVDVPDPHADLTARTDRKDSS